MNKMRIQSVKSINLCESVVQTSYDIVSVVSLFFSCQLSESLIMRITRITLKKKRMMKLKIEKSVKSTYLCKSVVQTMIDILKTSAGELKVETRVGVETEILPIFLIHESLP